MGLVDKFFSLRCAPDVLEAVYPLNNASKEISEAMSLIRVVKGLILKFPNQYTLIDACAGNALTGIIAAHLLPVNRVIAVDIKPRYRKGHDNVSRFTYLQGDITQPSTWKTFPLPYIVVASHPCGELARDIVVQTRTRSIPVAVLTCCRGKGLPQWTSIVESSSGAYIAWAAYLAALGNGKATVVTDCLSPCNILVTRGL